MIQHLNYGEENVILFFTFTVVCNTFVSYTNVIHDDIHIFKTTLSNTYLFISSLYIKQNVEHEMRRVNGVNIVNCVYHV